MALEHFKTQVLLLHSQQRILDALSSGINKRYTVHCATSGSEALNTLTETPIHVIVSAQELPGMSGLEAIREARKRSPDTVGILLAGNNQDAVVEAMVGDQELFEIVTGDVSPEKLREIVDAAMRKIRMLTLSQSANDHTANVDVPIATGEHIIMETSGDGSTIITDATGPVPAMKLQSRQNAPVVNSQHIAVLVLTKDEEFLATIRDSARGLHNVHHALTPTQAEDCLHNHNVGVLLTDAAMVGPNIEALTVRLRSIAPRLIAVVAGRRDDGEMLMDLINRGQVYRFLLKPVSPGRARLAIEASAKYHMEAPDNVFSVNPRGDAGSSGNHNVLQQGIPAAATTRRGRSGSPSDRKAAGAEPATAPLSSTMNGLDDAFVDDPTFGDTVTGLKTTMGHSIAVARGSLRATRNEALSMTGQLEQPEAATRLWSRKPILAVVTLVVAAAAYVLWQPFASKSPDVPIQTRTSQTFAPPAADNPAPAAVSSTSDPETLLQDARIARDSGQLVTPEGANAVELYSAALAASGNNPQILAEFNELLNLVFSSVESALLARRMADAKVALTTLDKVAADNPRLSFLNAQFNQQQYRDTGDQVRIAIRDGRYEDAARLLTVAQGLPGVRLNELDLLIAELEGARSEQRVDEVLALASQRVDDGNLTSPSNDNARYYYELALSNDPQNSAAREGLIVIAGALVLNARAATDAGRLDRASTMLSDAQVLDPGSGDLAQAQADLDRARREQQRTQQNREADRQAEQAQAAERAEAERQATARAEADQQAAARAEADRQAAARAEADRRAAAKAQADRQAEADRRIAAQAKAEEDRRAAAAAAAAVVAASSSTETNSDSGGTRTASQSAQEDLLAAATVASASLIAEGNTTNSAAPTAGNPTPAQQVAEMITPPAGPETVSISTLNRTKYVSPKYPRNAMRRNVTGSVAIKFTVATDGSVYDIEVVESEPGTTFDDSATQAVAKWRFDPVVEGGVPVEKRSAVRMAFDLQ